MDRHAATEDRRPKTGDKHAAILRAAARTIAEDGIGAPLPGIAKAAAVAEGSLFRYFPDKDKPLNKLYRDLKSTRRMQKGCPISSSEIGAGVPAEIRGTPAFHLQHSIYRGCHVIHF
jgi:hypothetical protein